MIYNFDKLSFQILNKGIYEHYCGFYKIAARPYAALSLRKSGEASFYVGGKHFKSLPGDVLFMPERVSYDVHYTDGKSIVVHLIECNYKNPENIQTLHGGMVNEAFSELLKHNDVNGEKSVIYKILQFLNQSSEMYVQDADMEKCIAYIEENYKNKIKTENICRAGNISEATLRRKFHKYCGMSAKEYLNKIRMNKAVDMLISGEKTVKETAFLCGFADEKYFSRLIKKEYNITPKQFRE